MKKFLSILFKTICIGFAIVGIALLFGSVGALENFHINFSQFFRQIGQGAACLVIAYLAMLIRNYITYKK